MAIIGEDHCYLSTEAAVARPLAGGARPADRRAASGRPGLTAAVCGAAARGAVGADPARSAVPIADPGRPRRPRPRRAPGPRRSRARRPVRRPATSSPGRCHSDDSVGTPGRRDEGAQPQAGRETAEVGGVVDGAAETRTPNAMLIRTRMPSWRTIAPARPDRPGDGYGPAASRIPNRPEDRARRADRRDVAAEHEARRRAGGGAGQVEGQEPDGSVPAFDDRAGQVQGVHVEEQVERVVRRWSSVTVHSRQYSPCGDGQLVQLEPVVEAAALRGQQRRQRHDRR